MTQHQDAAHCYRYKQPGELFGPHAPPLSQEGRCLSVSLYTEWQQVLTRAENLPPARTAEDTRNYLRYLASQSHLQEIHFLWRPFLPDADDDMVLELAFAARCRHIVTHNVKDFRGSEELGVTVLSPRELLTLIRQKL